MVTQDDIRRICASLPGATEGGGDRFAFGIEIKGKHKGFLWSWAERVDPKKARFINDRVIAVSTPNLMAKEMLLQAHPEFCFTEPHYNGYPAVLIRLEDVTAEELEPLIIEAWKCKATKDLLGAFAAGSPE